MTLNPSDQEPTTARSHHTTYLQDVLEELCRVHGINRMQAYEGYLELLRQLSSTQITSLQLPTPGHPEHLDVWAELSVEAADTVQRRFPAPAQIQGPTSM